MRPLFIIFILLLTGYSCKKEKSNLPSEYYGTWIAETPQFLQTSNRIYTLTLNKNVESSYTSEGAYEYLNADYEGMALMMPPGIYIDNHFFHIDTIPTKQDDGSITMYVEGKEFFKQ